MEILASKEIPVEWGAEHGFLGKKKKKSNNTKQQVIPETLRAGRNPQENRIILEHPGRLPGGGNLATDTREKKYPRWKGRALEIKPQEGVGGEPVSR